MWLNLQKNEITRSADFASAVFDHFKGEESTCPVSVVILLLVKYAPELTVTQVVITITINKNIFIAIIIRKNTILTIIMVQEPPQTSKGGSIKISCTADANPPQVEQ